MSWEVIMVITAFREAGIMPQLILACSTDAARQNLVQGDLLKSSFWHSSWLRAKIEYVFFFWTATFAQYVGEVITSKQFPMKISTLWRGSLLTYETSEYICALLTYCQETQAVLSFVLLLVARNQRTANTVPLVSTEKRMQKGLQADQISLSK